MCGRSVKAADAPHKKPTGERGTERPPVVKRSARAIIAEYDAIQYLMNKEKYEHGTTSR